MSTQEPMNKYKVRRQVRDFVNETAKKYSANAEITIHAKSHMHIVDRITDREFEMDEFKFIVEGLFRDKLRELLYLCSLPREERKIRYNVYGNDSHMVGFTIRSFSKQNAHHIEFRTCYKERNSKHRERGVECYKIKLLGE